MTIHFSDTLARADVKRHIPHLFTLPDGMGRVKIHLHYDPAQAGDARNMLTLTVFDPHGFRGAGHRGGQEHIVEITPDTATPGYLPGPLPAGEWTVQIDTHMIGPDAPCDYTISVEYEAGESSSVADPRQLVRFDSVINDAPGWYRGELHCHTRHSDGSWNVTDLVAAAHDMGLDFITLTDHNTVSPLPEMARLSGNGLLTLGGMELTTFWGHAVCLGAGEWIDWRVDSAGHGMAAIAEAVYARGDIFIIAHPKSIGDPWCTGCRWVYPKMMPGTARFVEIWNGAWHGGRGEKTSNEEGLTLWYGWLNEGRRLIATAGSDSHSLDHYKRGPGFSVVYAPQLSRDGILTGIKDGHLYLSSGPSLSFTAQTEDGASAMMGDVVPAGGGQIHLHATWANVPYGAQLRLIGNAAPYARHLIDGDGEQSWHFPAQADRWYVLEVRNAEGAMLAMTNPIFVGDW
ncbi:phosphotransferase [bacterium]|nr:phosphotransferase [bacterium]